ncbi:MAG: type I-C CRISPR-associated protein Cas5c [Lachnospiraceae bacterium]|nr:type I-C CRISPR-associated protein Cas5c [Lachnospiraceae bacterium]
MSQNQRQSELVARYMKDKKVTFEVHAHMALFADPIISAGGEKTTYSAPTYEAIKGVCKSIYWKPTFIWVVDKVRIMNEIKTEVSGKKLLRTDGTNDLANYTYLTDVSYQVMAHIEWNENRSEYKGDRDWLKHYILIF